MEEQSEVDNLSFIKAAAEVIAKVAETSASLYSSDKEVVNAIIAQSALKLFGKVDIDIMLRCKETIFDGHYDKLDTTSKS